MQQALVLGALAAATTLGASNRAYAQEMGQGEARITSDSEVKLQVRSGPATNRDKLMEIGQVVGGQMASVRGCYAGIVRKDPAVRGKLSFLLTLGQSVQLETKVDEVHHQPLMDCVVKAIKAANYRSVKAPGAAYLLLEFENSAAEGVARTRELRASEDAVTVTKTSAGKFEARGGTREGTVLYRVEASTEPAAAGAARTMRASIPTLLDCHRKAGRKGGNPEGEIDAKITVAKGGSASVQVTRNTISNRQGTDKAEQCVTKGLGKTTFPAESVGRVDLTLTFKREGAAAPPGGGAKGAPGPGKGAAHGVGPDGSGPPGQRK